MKQYQYGFKECKNDYTHYLCIYAKSLESALKQAKAYIKEVYGTQCKIVSIMEVE